MIQPKRQKTMFGKIHDACGILAKVQDLQDRYNSMAIFIISHYFGTSGMADDHSDIGKHCCKVLSRKNPSSEYGLNFPPRKRIYCKN